MNTAQPQHESGLVQHLTVLRKNLLIYLAGFAIVFVLAIACSQYLFSWIAQPLIQLLPASHHLVATQVAAPVVVPVKLAFWVSLICTVPVLFWQLWRFMLPGLYAKEMYLLLLPLLLSLVLFYAGIAFAYFVVIPLLLHFFISMLPQQVIMMADIGYYLGFVMRLAVICGLMFEIPVLIAGLIVSERFRLQQISDKRPYIILACFVLAMLFTPPDVVSQLVLALPMWLLFELGLVLGYGVMRYRNGRQSS